MGTTVSKDAILLIEDSKMQAKVLHDILKHTYDVTCVYTAAEAFQALSTHKYELILLDLILPDQDGFAVLQKIRGEAQTKDIPVIIITSITGDKSEERGLLLGAVDYIAKPFNPIIVMARIQVHIRLYKYAKQFEELTMVDQLTGIGNKRYLDASSVECWNRCVRQRTPMSICMFDIDKFKAYNDTYGHPEGDKVIVKIAEVLKKSFGRCTDIVARYGGEEFLVITTDGDAVKDFNYVCQVRKRVEELAIKHGDTDQPHVTVSAGGITVYPRREEQVAGFIRIADAMLYKSKANGRNRVTWTSDRFEEWTEKESQ